MFWEVQHKAPWYLVGENPEIGPPLSIPPYVSYNSSHCHGSPIRGG